MPYRRLTAIPFHFEPTALAAGLDHAVFHSISQPEASAYGSRSRKLNGIAFNGKPEATCWGHGWRLVRQRIRISHIAVRWLTPQ
jgi:hypothetical protein